MMGRREAFVMKPDANIIFETTFLSPVALFIDIKRYQLIRSILPTNDCRVKNAADDCDNGKHQ